MLSIQIQEIPMPITLDYLWELHAKHATDIENDPCYGSKSTPLFEIWDDQESYVERHHALFNPINWCSGMDLARGILTTLIDRDDLFPGYCKRSKYVKTVIEPSYGLVKYALSQLEIYYIRTKDTTRFSIFQYIIVEGTTVPELCHTYNVMWYKERGCTESLLLDGESMEIDEYIDLLNMLLDTKYGIVKRTDVIYVP